MKFQRFILLPVLCFFVGCVSYNTTPLLDKGGFLNNDQYGILLISNGRLQGPGLFTSKYAVNVDWWVYPLDAKGERLPEPIWKIPWEDASVGLMNPGGFLGEGTYGFIFFKELPVGKYHLIAFTGSASDTNYGGFIVVGTAGQKSGIGLEIEVLPRVVNYAGEILSIDKGLDIEKDFRFSNELDRDLAYAINKKPSLKDLEVVTALVQPLR